MSNAVQPASDVAEGANLSPPLALLVRVLDTFESDGIRYCHWKSNYHIDYALAAQEDVDVLVHAEDFPRFVGILMSEGFKQADSPSNRMQPGVFHFLGNDPETGSLINIHAYTRILTGDHFMKSWALPFEAMLLERPDKEKAIRVASGNAELIVFTLRNMVKCATLYDFRQFIKSQQAIREELDWILARSDRPAVHRLLHRHFPEVDPASFDRAVELLGLEGRVAQKWWLGRQVARKLRKYCRYGRLSRLGLGARVVSVMAYNKFVRRQKHMRLLTGGKVIALIGPQATGKSTLIAAVRDWLGAELSVRTVHAGKPPPSWVTWLPTRLIPLARKITPASATDRIEVEAQETGQARFPIIYLLRKIMLAYDRRKLLRSVFRDSRRDRLVLVDRYPSDAIGAIDGPSFDDASIAGEASMLKRALMRMERALYSNICPPDLVISLSVSVEKAVERNQTRIKEGKQTTEYVIARHQQRVVPAFDRCPVVDVCTDAPLPDTLLQVKAAVWGVL